MTIHSIEYKNFRNIEHEKLVFDPRMNLICGINGQGKTNALEAICYLSTGRSYRSGVKEKDFIMEGKTAAEISVVYESGTGQGPSLSAFSAAGGRNTMWTGSGCGERRNSTRGCRWWRFPRISDIRAGRSVGAAQLS